MLDSRGGGAGAAAPEDQSGEFGSSGPMRERRPAAVGAGGKRGDMDDEIPF
jgi:single-strand DNA-binding protein